ncbi:Hypothetical predicted protein [Octopus vulgaris]|uniref:Uncharacterized protein n=1 Tax=Octopus vulgaris TaxID=6645 RepID=A0AA36AKA3_OCTVU|nr:Hypothetical predicted protein [Octopus vulgaris]
MDAMLSLWQRPQTQQQRKLHAATMDAVRIYCYPTHAAVSQPVFPRLGQPIKTDHTNKGSKLFLDGCKWDEGRGGKPHVVV